MQKVFCRSMSCLKTHEFENNIPSFCPWCGTPYLGLSKPGVNADKPIFKKQSIESKIDSSRLPFFKKKTESKQNVELEDDDSDDGIPIEIPNVSAADVKFDVGQKTTIGSFIKNGETPQRVERNAVTQEILNKDLENMLAQAKQTYPQAKIKSSKPNKVKTAYKKKNK